MARIDEASRRGDRKEPEGGNQTVDQQEKALIEKARAGDRVAFTALTLRYGEMALGYALSILRDLHAAQDVAQETLFIAYRSLGSLEDADRFPAWLRGIVRFQCGRVLRARRFDLVGLEDVHDMPSSWAGPEQHLEIAEGFDRVLTALRSLPQAQREAALLFYIKDYSQREIAAFLELPVTTVNNRLHAARKGLKEKLTMTSTRIGRVVAVHGLVVDVQFEVRAMPLLLGALRLAVVEEENSATLQVVQHAGGGLVRCLIHGSALGVAPGAAVVDKGIPALARADATTLTQIIPLLGATARSGSARPVMLETGIKVIDLLCPYTAGGTVGFFGPAGMGRMVVSAEVIRNLTAAGGSMTIFAFSNGEAEARGLYDAPEEAPQPLGASQFVCLPIDDSIDAASPAVLAASPLLDARTYFSATLGRSGLWPSIDPLLSTSRLLDPTIVGKEHYAVAADVRQLLRRYRDLQEGGLDGQGRSHSAGDRALIARARRVQKFLTQPFAVAAPFTGRPGEVVPFTETLRDCMALLAGAYDDVPEETLIWRGALNRTSAHVA